MLKRGLSDACEVLEHHLRRLAQVSRRNAVAGADRLAVEDQFAGIAADEIEHDPRQGRLAAAGFTDDADGLAFAEAEGHIVDRMQIGSSGQKAGRARGNTS